MDTFDLLIVGAGPAGSAAALRALQLDPGARVAILDRRSLPRDKSCGDGLGPEGVRVLEGLGVRDRALDGAPPLWDVSITSPSGVMVTGSADRPGYVVPRRRLDARLLEAARDRGAQFRRHRVRHLEPRGRNVIVDGALRARVVVGADGAHSSIRRLVGAGSQPSQHRGIALRGYAPASTVEAGLEFRFLADPWPAYRWAFPLGDGAANVGVCVFDTSRPVTAAWLRAALLAAEPRVDPRSLLAAQLPLASARPAVGHGQVLLAGDAAALVNPLTGEGIATALLSGALAGAAAVLHPDAPGDHYRRWLRWRLGRHLRHLRLARWAFAHRTAVDRAVDAARRDQELLTDLVLLGLGTGPLTPRMLIPLLGRRAAPHPAGRRSRRDEAPGMEWSWRSSGSRVRTPR